MRSKTITRGNVKWDINFRVAFKYFQFVFEDIDGRWIAVGNKE